LAACLALMSIMTMGPARDAGHARIELMRAN
jgi:hypothetical protein